MTATVPPKRLLSIMEASRVLHPILKPTNATNWLADRRRRTGVYKTFGVAAPRCVKYKGTWHYPIDEIKRVYFELKAAKGMS